jgi:DNA-binding XRE family transcriptional regulator
MKKHTTRFAEWVEEMGFTQKEAGEKLGLNREGVVDYMRGHTYHNPPKPAAPDLRTRRAMQAIKEGLLPWPE